MRQKTPPLQKGGVFRGGAPGRAHGLDCIIARATRCQRRVQVLFIKGGYMKKVLLKRTADALEKLAIAGMAMGLFQDKTTGIWAGSAFMGVSYAFTIWESKK
jgi:hypothetical protein